MVVSPSQVMFKLLVLIATRVPWWTAKARLYSASCWGSTKMPRFSDPCGRPMAHDKAPVEMVGGVGSRMVR